MLEGFLQIHQHVEGGDLLCVKKRVVAGQDFIIETHGVETDDEVGAAQFINERIDFLFAVNPVFATGGAVSDADAHAHLADFVPAADFFGGLLRFEVKINGVLHRDGFERLYIDLWGKWKFFFGKMAMLVAKTMPGIAFRAHWPQFVGVIRLVLFDIDGTLLHTGGVGIKSFGRAFASEFEVHNGTAGMKFAGRTDVSLVREVFVRHGIEPSPRNFERFFSAYLSFMREMMVDCTGGPCPGVLEFQQALAARAEPP